MLRSTIKLLCARSAARAFTIRIDGGRLFYSKGHLVPRGLTLIRPSLKTYLPNPIPNGAMKTSAIARMNRMNNAFFAFFCITA